ncbi:Polynucleotide kinase 3 phosphatase/AAA domain containing protein [Novymonas esmeraldas]|uniref:Polynucleotide kinase 3 phosphatase/AAA domain containing protein n=1 Tax=Novymonas esmeraldas TaxID=1808958 RepID=A0AAW0F2N5_9TRYP
MAKTGKRRRSPTPPPPPSPPSIAAGDAAAPARHVREWERVEGDSVLLLPPTAAILAPLVHKSNSVDGTVAVKVAAFDMDDTLIMPASGGVFAKDDAGDWKWLHPNVRGHLQHLHANGFLVVLFSNQLGIGKGTGWHEEKARAVTAKIVQLSAAAGVPLCACVATREDSWRKPSPRMWGLLEERVQKCVRNALGVDAAAASPAVDCLAFSFFVGDAAGRLAPTLAGRKKDFSASDRAFAHNMRLPFFTPEMFFLSPVAELLQADALYTRCGSAALAASLSTASARLSDSMMRQSCAPVVAGAGVTWGDVSPAELQQLPHTYAGLHISVVTATAVDAVTLPTAPPFFARPGVQEMVILMGFPGSGKSTFAERHLRPHGYQCVNRDKLKSRDKCVKAATEHWAAGRSVVVDNTNPSAEERQSFIDIVRRAAGAGLPTLPVRIFVFAHSRGLASHMNRVRAQVQDVPRVPTIAYNIYQSKLELPTTPADVAALGIDSVVEVPAVASFDDVPADTKTIFFQLQS